MRFVREEPQQDIGVDMTPLIDVTFLLLIFFMIISVFNQMERAAKVDLPAVVQAVIQKDVAEQRMVVNIERDGSIVLFGQPVTMAGFKEQLRRLGPALRQLGEKAGKSPLIIRADKQCPFEHIKAVLATLYEENITKIMFAGYERKPEGALK